GGCLFDHRRLDVYPDCGGGVEAQLVWVCHPDDLDYLVFGKARHTVAHGAFGDIHFPGNVCEGFASILLQMGDDVAIDLIHKNYLLRIS
ncbi:MAG: hypothetical protein MUO76_14895, partial [Anaerolineaceae bacterium]|nr:hypothetical protein [Anaerolineaceae bacterium]